MSYCQKKLLPSWISIFFMILVYANSHFSTSHASLNFYNHKIHSLNSQFPKGQSHDVALTYKAREYQGSVSVDVQAGQTQNIKFWITFVQNPTNCRSKLCFFGWVSKYSVNGQTEVSGYPNAQGLQPIFSFVVSDDQNYKVSYSNSLGQVWKEIIEIASQKFNPLEVTQQNKNRKFVFLNENPKLSRTASLVSGIPRTQARITENIKLSGLRQASAINTQSVSLNQNKIITARSQKFNINLKTDKVQTESGQIPIFNAKIIIDLTKLTSTQLSLDAANKVLSLLSQRTSNIKAFSKLQIQNIRKSQSRPSLFPKDAAEVDLEPKIQIQGSKSFPGQIYDDVDVVGQFKNPTPITNAKIPISNSAVIVKGGTHAILNDIPVTKIPILGKNEHLVAGTSNPLLNHIQILYDKAVFSRKIALKIQTLCNLIQQANSQKIQCKANLIYTIFDKEKIIKIFQFTQPINTNWKWGKNYDGSWDFSFSIPLPPPVSFMTIHFSVGIKYAIEVKLESVKISNTPYVYKLGALVTAGITANARASLRAIVIEGGVFIRGTIVKVGTDPSLILTFNFAEKNIQVLRQWFFWIIAFQFEWGFFYRNRNWRLKWSGDKIIKSWTVNGIYKKETIVNNKTTIKI